MSSPSIRHVLVVALVVRAAVIVSSLMVTGGTIGFINPDTDDYVEPATAFLETGTFALGGQPDITRTPGYPIFLLPGIALGHVEIITLVGQVLLSCLTVYGVYRLGLELLGDGRAALLGACVYAVEPVSILFSAKVVSETLFTAILVLFLLAATKYLKEPRWRTIIVAAMLLAAAIYVRPIAYYLPALATPFLLVRALVLRRAARLLAAQAAVFFIVSAGLISLWHVRNYAATGYSGFTANIESNLYYVEAAQVLAVERGVAFKEMAHRLGYSEELRYQNRPAEFTENKGAHYAAMRRKALDIIAEHPLTYLRNRAHAVLRTVLNPGGFEYMVLYDVYPGHRILEAEVLDKGLMAGAIWMLRERTALFWTNIALAVILAIIYLCAVMGFVSRRLRLTAPVLLALMVGAYFVGTSLGSSRFRHPVMPIIAVFAGYGAVCVWVWLRTRWGQGTLAPG